MSDAAHSQGGRVKSKTSKKPAEFAPHPLLVRLANEGVDPVGTITLAGYLGPADANGAVRIYLDLGFRTYISVPAKKIVYVEDADPAHETRPTNIVLVADAPLSLVESVGASYLQGSIVSAYPLAVPPTPRTSGKFVPFGCTPTNPPSTPQRLGAGRLAQGSSTDGVGTAKDAD